MKCMKTLLYWSHIHRNTHMGSIWETRVQPWGPDPDVIEIVVEITECLDFFFFKDAYMFVQN